MLGVQRKPRLIPCGRSEMMRKFLQPNVHMSTFNGSLLARVVNGSVLVRVHGRPGTGIVKEKVESELDSEQVFLLRN